MPRLCSICTHPDREAIDEALLVHDRSYAVIASEFGLDDSALQWHERQHLRLCWQESKELAAALSAENLLRRIAQLDAEVQWGINESKKRGDLRALAVFVNVAGQNIERYVKLTPYVDAKTVSAQIAAPVVDPQPDEETMRQVLRNMIDAGMAMTPADHTANPAEPTAPYTVEEAADDQPA